MCLSLPQSKPSTSELVLAHVAIRFNRLKCYGCRLPQEASSASSAGKSLCPFAGLLFWYIQSTASGGRLPSGPSSPPYLARGRHYPRAGEEGALFMNPSGVLEKIVVLHARLTPTGILSRCNYLIHPCADEREYLCQRPKLTSP